MIDPIRYEMVWKQTFNTYREMVSAEGWSDKEEIDIPVAQELTFKVSSTNLCCTLFLYSILIHSPACPHHHWKMRVQVLFQLVHPSQIPWRKNAHPGGPENRIRNLHDRPVPSQVDQESTNEKVCNPFSHYPTHLTALSGCKSRKRPTSSSWSSCIPKSPNAKPRLHPGPAT